MTDHKAEAGCYGCGGSCGSEPCPPTWGDVLMVVMCLGVPVGFVVFLVVAQIGEWWGFW